MKAQILQKFARFLLKVMFQFRIEGRLPPAEGAYILCANHASNWDAVALFAAANSDTSIIAKRELERAPVVGWILRGVNLIYVDRDGMDIKPLRQMLQVLEQGHGLGIFPEGHRYKKADPSHMSESVGYLVQKAKVPVYCVYMDSTYRFRASFKMSIRPVLSPELLLEKKGRLGRYEITQILYNTIYEADAPLEAFLPDRLWESYRQDRGDAQKNPPEEGQ